MNESSLTHIVMHSFELTYRSKPDGTPMVTLLNDAADETIQPCRAVLLDESSQRVAFQFDSPIPKGRYQLDVSFDGILNDQLCGFYRSAYTSARDGSAKFMAVTQFEGPSSTLLHSQFTAAMRTKEKRN